MKQVLVGLMLVMLCIGMLTLAFNIQPVRASGTIYIRADGSIDRARGLHIDAQPLVHDVAVTNCVSMKTVVGQGYSGNVSITVANQGDITETFNVTAYANATAIDTQQLSLNATNQTTLTFTWNTTSCPYENYLISAYAWPVQNETDTANNNCTGNWVILTIPGDMNGDFKVSLVDLVILANAYGSHCANYHYQGEPASPNWNPNADVNNDGIVNLLDLVSMANHYGQQYPLTPFFG